MLESTIGVVDNFNLEKGMSMVEETEVAEYDEKDTDVVDYGYEDVDVDIPKIDIMNVNDSSLTVIDRAQENKDVTRFQENGDLELLGEIYKARIPTLKMWAHQHYYPGLIASIEDLFEELSVVFIKAAHHYNSDRGTFNTCLYTFLLNRLKNIKNSKHAKKRISEHYDGPLSGMILSLDYTYGDSEGTEITLKDVIPNDPHDKTGEEIIQDTCLEETINVLSKGDATLVDALRKIGEGNSVASLVKSYKRKTGYVKLSPADATKFRKRKCNRQVSDIISEKKFGLTDSKEAGFSMIEYIISGTRCYYEIEMKRSKESDMIMKLIRDLRKNKDYYMKHLHGTATA